MKLSEASQRYSACSKCNPPLVSAGSMNNVKAAPPNLNDKQLQSDSIRRLSSEPTVGTTKHGQTIYEGPRGGLYHYSKSGKKVYERKKH